MLERYGCIQSLVPVMKKKNKASNAQRRITHVWPKVQQNLIWCVGNGRSIYFWQDHQILGIHSVLDLVSLEANDEILNQNLVKYIDGEGQWDWMKLNLLLRKDSIDLIAPLKAPEEGLGEDSIVWLPTSIGMFSIKLAYEVCKDVSYQNNNKLFSTIWKAKAPQCFQTLLWLSRNEAL